MVSPITAIGPPDQPVNQVSGPGTIQRITQAIKQASARTGVDFSYLLNKASQESNFDPNAKATGSSATGLFQFTGQTWLQMVKSHGDQYGLSQYAGHITTDANGVAHVSDPNWRHAILALRKDPTVSAEMAGELDKQNASTLQADVGGKIGPTELYLAHFLGAGGAGDFIDKLRSAPNASAAAVVPDAAAANRSVFYDKSGAPRSVKQIYQQFAQKFNHAPQIPSDNTMFASAGTATSTPASLNVADASNIDGVPNGFAPPVTSSVTLHSPALYNAMVIAQLDMKNMVGNELGSLADAHKKNSVLAAPQIIA